MRLAGSGMRVIARWAIVAVAAMALGACKHQPTRSIAPPADRPGTGTRAPVAHAPIGTWPDQDGGPPIPPDVSRVAEPTPVPEPPAAYGNKSPYTVLGRTYRVLPTSRGYVERGIASWYGTKFHGRLTSSREQYDMYQLTAAHKTLPLPTFVRVTNLENGRSIVVRVNDRGPFHESRIIDLSYAAAIKLGIQLKGTGQVEVRAIDPQHPELAGTAAVSMPAAPRSAPTPRAAPRAATAFNEIARGKPVFLQVGSFSNRDNARRLAKRLEDADIDDVFLDRALTGGHLVHRVRVGPIKDPAEATAISARLRRMGVGSLAVPVD